MTTIETIRDWLMTMGGNRSIGNDDTYENSENAEEALRAVADLHAEVRIFDECEHEHTEDDVKAGRAFNVSEVGYVCQDGYRYSICRECCRDGDYQTEGCATYHEHTADGPQCPTVHAIAQKLQIVPVPA
jgi:hypothetical protein